MQPAVVATGGLKDGTAHAMPPRPVAQGAAAGLVVGEAAGEPAGAEGWAAVAPLAKLSGFMSCAS